MFVPSLEAKKDWIIKYQELFIEKQAERAIVPAIAVEEGHPQSYYIRLTLDTKGNRLSVHLDPATDPIKTRGVKRSIAFMAESILSQFPHLQIDQSNLSEYLNRKDIEF